MRTMSEQAKGFDFWVEQDQIERYRQWPAQQKLKRLLYAIKLRKSLPGKIIKRQEEFRKGRR